MVRDRAGPEASASDGHAPRIGLTTASHGSVVCVGLSSLKGSEGAADNLATAQEFAVFEPTPHADPIVPVDADASACLSVGTQVCVWNQSLDCWTSGFAIAEITRFGYRLRRVSDGHLFDYVFSFRDVRVERPRDPFRGIEESLRDLGDVVSEED